ncbi:unnamed protein product [Rhodiola kirilowii]
MSIVKKVSPFQLASLLRSQKDPHVAFELFRNPNPDLGQKPFRYSLLSYDLMIMKLGKAKMFDEMEKVLTQMKGETRFVAKEIIFCNVMGFYGRGRLPERALRMYEMIPDYGFERTVKSLNSLLNAFLVCRDFGRMSEIVECGGDGWEKLDVCSYNILIHSCVLRSDFDAARKVFDEMRERGVKPNAVTFGTLISGFCGNMKMGVGLWLKEEMLVRYGLKPNVVIYTSLIKGCFKVGDFDLGLKLKEEMLRDGLQPDAAFYTTVFSAMVEVGRKKEAAEVLGEMKRKECKFSTATYNAMISGFCRENDFGASFRLLNEMEGQGCKPDVISFNVIIGGLCRDGKWREAKDLFEDMPRRGCAPDVVTYRMLFDGLCDTMQLKEAALVLDDMVRKHYAPRAACLNKLIAKLCNKANAGLLWSVWSALERHNVAIDSETWNRMISMISNKDQQSDAVFLMNTLLLL